MKMKISRFRLSLLERYIIKSFLSTLGICLFIAVSLFLVFDLFERMRVFVKADASILDILAYLLFKIPLILHLMLPVAVLIAVLFSIGRLSQRSEITAMRACGISLLRIARPLLVLGLLLTLCMLLLGETVVPYSSDRVEEIYRLDIQKHAETGRFSRSNYWFRSGQNFFSIDFYDSRTETLNGLTIFNFDRGFRLSHKTDAAKAQWVSDLVGWEMQDVVEFSYDDPSRLDLATYAQVPLVIEETPEDLYNYQRKPETMSYRALSTYIQKLRNEGVPVTEYLVDLAAKISFPFVTTIVVLIAFPFALIPARSGNLTKSFIAGVTIGFGYHVVHALSTALGSAELLPIVLSAWTANLLLGSVGGFLMAGVEGK